MAPLWDFCKGQFVGVLSALDFILILREVCLKLFWYLYFFGVFIFCFKSSYREEIFSAVHTQTEGENVISPYQGFSLFMRISCPLYHSFFSLKRFLYVYCLRGTPFLMVLIFWIFLISSSVQDCKFCICLFVGCTPLVLIMYNLFVLKKRETMLLKTLHPPLIFSALTETNNFYLHCC